MKPALRIISHPSPPSELERDLEESCKLVELAKAGATFVRPHELPSAECLAVTHGTPYTLTAKAWHELGGRGCG